MSASAAWSTRAASASTACDGNEQYCLNGNVGTYAVTDRDGTTTQGGYSTHVVVTTTSCWPCPRGIDPAAAAPLLCAGITTYSPLQHWSAGPGKKVAVVGLGGLGHMGVKIAHAMGAEVTVLSQSLKKQEDGAAPRRRRLLRHQRPGHVRGACRTFDLILNTVSASLDIDAYLRLLAVDGALVNVGAPPEPFSVNPMSLLDGRRTFAGSMIGGMAETQEMLDFCAEHGIGSEIEVIPAEANQRGVRAGARLRRAVPVRHRHRHDRLSRPGRARHEGKDECSRHGSPRSSGSSTPSYAGG